MSFTWRLIPPLEASAETQMAIDRYLLEEHRQGRHPPTLRFYTWQPAAISLGYHQKDYPATWQNLRWQGKPLDIVRRPTGGRAVLHQGDLTYMVVTSLPTGKRLEVYKQICQFLLTGWRSLGVKLDYGTATKEYIQNPNCFATATGSDLVTTTGSKVIGSAQLRRGKAILQHGSMILNTDAHLYQQVFGVPLEQNLLTSIKPARDYSQDQIIQNLTQAAITTFKIDIVEQSLSTKEWQDIASDFSLLRY
ncbi:MAG: lipoate--protein ligase family protein [Waterburya sp.]